MYQKFRQLTSSADRNLEQARKLLEQHLGAVVSTIGRVIEEKDEHLLLLVKQDNLPLTQEE